MSDERLRDLERRYAEGDLEAGERLVNELRRRGQLSDHALRLRDLEGDLAAARVLGVPAALARIEAWVQRERPALTQALRAGAEPGAPGWPASLRLLLSWRGNWSICPSSTKHC